MALQRAFQNGGLHDLSLLALLTMRGHHGCQHILLTGRKRLARWHKQSFVSACHLNDISKESNNLYQIVRGVQISESFD